MSEAAELRKIRICRWCLGRLHSSDAGSVEAVGSKIASELGIGTDDAGCQLCGGMFSRLGELVEGALDGLAGLELRSFYVSVSVPFEMREAEDELRSRLRLRGGLSAKRLAIRMISREIERRLGVPASPRNPDAILEFTPEGLRAISLMPMYLEGRYVKPAEEPAGGPGGLEGEVTRSLAAALAADEVRMIWLGTDFEGIEVAGRGRPFLAKVLGARRRISWPRALGGALGDRVLSLRALGDPRAVSGLAGRRAYDVVLVEAEAPSAPEDLDSRLRALEGSEIRCGGGSPRRVARALGRAEGGYLIALICVEHGVDPRLLPECVAGGGRASRALVLDVVEDCAGYPLGWYAAGLKKDNFPGAPVRAWPDASGAGLSGGSSSTSRTPSGSARPSSTTPS